MTTQRAFFVRQTTIKDWSDEAIKSSKIYIGWARAEGLIEKALGGDYYDLRQAVKNQLYSSSTDFSKAGAAAGQLWRFIKEVTPGTIVVVPCSGGVYVGEVISECMYNPEYVAEDRAYYHDVKWICNRPIKRTMFRNDLQRAMKSLWTLTDISAYREEVLKVVSMIGTANAKNLSLREDIRKPILQTILDQLYNGRLNDHAFERLIDALLKKKGYETRIVPRRYDTGTDIEASLNLFGGLSVPVFVQIKQYEPNTKVGKEVFIKLKKSMEEKQAEYGVVISTAELDDDALQYIQIENEGPELYQFAFIGGEQLCEELISTGIFPDFEF